MNRKFYFVDRNVISLIKESNDKKRQGIKRKILMLNKLKKSDRKNSYIIPFLSIREGQTGQIESVQSIKKTIKDDNKPLSQFFKEALIYDYSLDDQDYIATVLSQENNKRSERYTQFLVDCALLLYQPVKNTDKEDVKGLIIKSAKENEIPLAHHFVVCCLSVLYGNSHARKVLKPKKNNFNAYNALSDLLHITDILNFKAAENIKYELLTLDNSLKGFFKLITIKRVTSHGGDTITNVEYNPSLFPDLTGNSFFELSRELGWVET